MSDINPAAPQPFDTGEAARKLYGDQADPNAQTYEQKQLVRGGHDADKLWPDGGDPSNPRKPEPQQEQRQQPQQQQQQQQQRDDQQQQSDQQHDQDAQSGDLDTPLDVPELRGEFDQHVSTLGIRPEAADKLYKQMAPAIRASQQEAHQQMIDDWADQSHEHYGDGLDKAVGYANAALSSYDGGRDLVQLLDKSGLSSHPATLRFLNAVHARRGGRR